jgi:uncharacterized ferritin-like protein (DUF455 family)
MNVRQFAHDIIVADSLAGKLASAGSVSWSGNHIDDDWRGEIPTAPGRPANLQIVHGKFAKVPPITGMRDPNQRARILHALANHELQAVELFAWGLLQFRDAPLLFQRGMLAILSDEQRHMKMYLDRLSALGHQFGDFGVTGHFWNKLDDYRTPLHFVCAMGLTFENANLDFCQEYADAASSIGDHQTEAVLREVHSDEIAHVHFAWTWLHKFAPSTPAWSTYLDHLEHPLGPHRARGKSFDRESRRRAGLSLEFIAQLEVVQAKRPSGQPR